MRINRLFVILLLLLTGCHQQESLSEPAKIARQYLMDQGYEIVAYHGDSWQQFSKADLLEMPNEQLWSVQRMEPDGYLDKRIDTISFTIRNHPLDGMFRMGQTSATVWLFDNDVIGGWSYPISEHNDVVGAPYSLDGLTANEMREGD